MESKTERVMVISPVRRPDERPTKTHKGMSHVSSDPATLLTFALLLQSRRLTRLGDSMICSRGFWRTIDPTQLPKGALIML